MEESFNVKESLEIPCTLPAMANSAGALTGASVTGSHVPDLISIGCLLFIPCRGVMVCVASRQYSSNLPQEGLEVICWYSF